MTETQVDTVECEFGHAFCRDCVIQYANSKLGEGSAVGFGVVSTDAR